MEFPNLARSSEKSRTSEPELKIRRRTAASAIYNKNFGNDRNRANSFVWGQNDDGDEGHINAFLYETDYQFEKNSIFGRAERVQKNAHELVLPAPHRKAIFGSVCIQSATCAI